MFFSVSFTFFPFTLVFLLFYHMCIGFHNFQCIFCPPPPPSFLLLLRGKGRIAALDSFGLMAVARLKKGKYNINTLLATYFSEWSPTTVTCCSAVEFTVLARPLLLFFLDTKLRLPQQPYSGCSFAVPVQRALHSTGFFALCFGKCYRAICYQTKMTQVRDFVYQDYSLKSTYLVVSQSCLQAVDV